MDEIFEKIKKEVAVLLKDNKGSHDFDHTERVYNTAMHLARVEKADQEIVALAALLHDVARKEQDDSNGKVCHAVRGAEVAKEILNRYDLPADKIEKICGCIAKHRFRDNNIPETLEEKIIFDADKLDSIGAVGIGRSFLFSGEIGARLHNKDVNVETTAAYSYEDTAYREFLVRKTIDEKILTEEGRRLTEHRFKFMAEFFEELNAEVSGEK